jgi:thioester reductase-like protein
VLLPSPDAINERDAVHRLLVGIAATRLAPTTFYTSPTKPYFGGVPVDLAARWLATIATRETRGFARYHVDEAERSNVSLDTLVAALGAELRVQRLPYEAWYEKFRAALAVLPEPARSRSPHQIIERWARPIDPAARRTFDNTRFRTALDLPVEVAPLSSTFIADWIRRILVRP